MLAIERRREILARLTLHGKVIVSDLAREFDVTEETIRRDLDRLESEGLASKTYGGAVSKYNASLELPYTIREEVRISEKQAIAEAVASLIQDGERVMLDASSTALYVFRRLKEKKDLTVITNSVKILLESADHPDWTVLSTGGTLRTDSLSLTGSAAEKTIRAYHADTAIFSCKGIDRSFGVSDSTEKESMIKQAMFDSASRRILCVDSDKFDKKAFVRLFGLADLDLLVTEKAPSDDWCRFCEEHGIGLIY
ncbi:MAG: DeoR/GlpR transcriptional regulator [Ruminococcaceae bacterium]|nr:DeoR/GlpR transcriptional regulator [Oscillospiraceae bacterium]